MGNRSQLIRLILDFYREDLSQRKQLEPLESCEVSRWWGVLYIRCGNQKTADAVLQARSLIEQPIALLRLAQKIKIQVGKHTMAAFAVQLQSTELLNRQWGIENLE